MQLFFTIFETVSFSLGILIIAILLTVNQNGNFAKQCLALFIGVQTLYAFSVLLFYSRLLLYVPFILPVISTITLLFYPLAYLYIRASLYRETQFRKWDALVLLPTIFFLFTLIPYLALPVAEQRAMLEVRYQSSGAGERQVQGLLPRYAFSLFRILWFAFFTWLSFRLLARFKEDYREGSHRAAMLQWLQSFTGWLAFLLVLAMPVVILAPLMDLNLAYGDFAVGATLVYVMFQLFRRPGLLYNFQYSARTQALLGGVEEGEKRYLFRPSGDQAGQLPDSDDPTELRYLHAVHSRLIEQQAFLDPDYSLKQLAADTNLPRYRVSSLINREYGMGFRDLLNYHRVQYFIKNHDRSEWSNLTLEAIGAECGFNNRSSFHRNFKLITGSTPSDFIKEKEVNSG